VLQTVPHARAPREKSEEFALFRSSQRSTGLWGAANLCHSAIYEPFREIAAEVARAVIDKQARLVDAARAC
jgi:hypothetical protein